MQLYGVLTPDPTKPYITDSAVDQEFVAQSMYGLEYDAHIFDVPLHCEAQYVKLGPDRNGVFGNAR